MCDKCKVKEKELKKLGMSFSTSTSMVSGFENVILCMICGKEITK